MRAIIFDLDGTLWDASLPITEAWREVGRKYFGPSYELFHESVCSMMGKTMDEIGVMLTPKNGDLSRKDEFIAECFSCENAYLSKHPGILFPQEEEVLGRLKENYDLYIVSNCQWGYIDNFIAILSRPFIKDHMCWSDTEQEKAVTIKALLARHGIDPKDALYVGDTQKDKVAAERAGIEFIYANYGFEKTPLESKHVINDIVDLPLAVKSIFKD